MRLERVWDYAKVLGHCTGANPFRWRSHLSILLPKPKELTRGHNAAVHYNDLPAFWERLRGRTGIGVEALRFTILTAVRTAEATGARWDEINFDTKVWTVPGVRMKMGKEHEVPLSAPALDLLRGLYEHRRSEFVFPGTKRGCPISTATMYAVLIRMGVDVTTHGFRSTFRDWCGDTTDFERDIIEMALAHEVKGVEGDYRRSRALEKRRVVMAAWARYCTGAAPPDNVIPLISAA
jgi:integrase